MPAKTEAKTDPPEGVPVEGTEGPDTAALEAAGVEAAAPNAVLVHRIEESGTISVQVQVLGNVRATEVETVLELGINAHRAQAGLSKRA